MVRVRGERVTLTSSVELFQDPPVDCLHPRVGSDAPAVGVDAQAGQKAPGAGRHRRAPSSVSHPRAAAGIAAVLSQLVQLSDLDLALSSHGVAVRQALDQLLDAISDLKGEVRSGGACQGPDVPHRHRPGEPIGSLRFAHFFFPFCGVGLGSLSVAPG